MTAKGIRFGSASPLTHAVLGAALLLGVPGCGTRLVPLRDQGAVLLQQPTEQTAMRAAITRALTARGYTAEAEQPGKIIARLDQRGVSLRLNIDYTQTQFAVSYIDSQGLNFQVGPQGPMISPRYNSYAENLRRSIRDELDRPARDAQAALDAQRQHELDVLEAQRRQQQDALNAQAAEHDRDRQAALEAERLRTARAQADADRAAAQQPIIVGHNATAVVGLAFNAGQVRTGRGVIRINPGFTPDPRTVNGTAGGNISAAQLNMPDGCAGFYSGQPAHTLVLAQDFNYLRIETSAPTDTTLAVVAPDGSVWCDDDGAGNTNARIAGQFPAGPYRIYVGNYQRQVISPFQLMISEIDAGPAQVAQPVQQAPQPAAPPDCRTTLIQMGHNPVHAIHCNGAEPYCAQALLQAGHNPAHLIHCQGVQPDCAVALLRAGNNPAQLINCH